MLSWPRINNAAALTVLGLFGFGFHTALHTSTGVLKTHLVYNGGFGVGGWGARGSSKANKAKTKRNDEYKTAADILVSNRSCNSVEARGSERGELRFLEPPPPKKPRGECQSSYNTIRLFFFFFSFFFRKSMPVLTRPFQLQKSAKQL